VSTKLDSDHDSRLKGGAAMDNAMITAVSGAAPLAGIVVVG
jgi:hypothetical protein